MVRSTNTFATDAYLDRIHFGAQAGFLSREPSLQLLEALHEAHLLAVPFENLSIHYGQPIILEEEALYHKIVGRRRGGFCYELNGLFAWLLRQLGFQVTLLSAGVAQGGGIFSPDFDHLALLIQHLDGADWLADVGFGDSFWRPLRIREDVEQDGGDGRRYRLLQAEHTGSDQSAESPMRDYWTLQQLDGDRWESQYRFTLEPHLLTEFMPRCWYHQTSPESHFTQKRICSKALSAGRISLSDLRLITTIAGIREERLVGSGAEYQQVLAERFGLVV
ncbi:MAG: arylamine N-acetyltransferase family protein [Ktedonobacterales bacterium]